ncbi:hypothetical protein [Chondromyces apiculatus]|uniref:Uncharacterized protein n=1 Tax=Chondromyces apiculatus DSM 436 TaxID=1192034 RepID=A0A017STS5_9BACT|nr:hypothetical protein [Chondromyces apiculatus]EYF00162.1 Hypothetical protein CAP_1123 [Chondromyces apiculatus DSM 436]
MATLLVPFLLGACSYVPPRFVDRPPVLDAGDEVPIRVPRVTGLLSADTITNLHVRHVLIDGLEFKRKPEAGDINAFDEVPSSSWFRPKGDLPPPDPPPVPPLTLLQPDQAGTSWPPYTPGSYAGQTGFSRRMTSMEGTVVAALDANGVRYVLRRDPREHPGLRTSAEATAAHLVRALGYFSPSVTLMDLRAVDFRNVTSTPPTTPTPPLLAPQVGASRPDLVRGFLEPGPPPREGRYRLSATRWPPSPGVDLGATVAIEVRSDDPNDRVPHRDRRTLRALGMLAGWLRMRELDPEHLRDVYVGEPGKGYVQHHLVALNGAFGADLVGAREEDAGILQRFFTLGLMPEAPPVRFQTRFPAIGQIDPLVTKRDIDPSPAFAPIDRASRGDEYWLARRIAALPPAVVVEAVARGQLGDPVAEAWLVGILEKRRKQLAAYAYGRVTPCDVDHVEHENLLLRDLGIQQGLWSAGATRYHVELLNDQGNDSGPERTLKPAGSKGEVKVPLPRPVVGAYLVVRLRVERTEGLPAEREPMEVHLIGQPAASVFGATGGEKAPPQGKAPQRGAGAARGGRSAAVASWVVRGIRH